MNANRGNTMSDISGKGYGASHNWKYGGSNDSHCSFYTCVDCRAFFVHSYNDTVDIFDAIKKASDIGINGVIPDVCEGAK